MKYSLLEIAEITGGKIVNSNGRENLPVDFFSTDSRKDCRNSMFVPLPGENFDSHKFIPDAIAAGASAVCVSENKSADARIPDGVPALLVKDTLAAYQSLGKHSRKKIDPMIIGLTGSSGKTSAKEILRGILSHIFGADCVYATEGNTNNHIGVPQNLLNLDKRHKYAIIEMGTNHFGEIELLSRLAEPDIGIIVSIGRAHTEFLGDTDGVAREKSSIFAGLASDGWAVIPAEGPGLEILSNAVRKTRTLRFGSEAAKTAPDLSVKYLGGSFKGGRFEISRNNGRGFRRTIDWALPGRHQAMNAGAAFLASEAAGAGIEAIADALSSGISLPKMRMNTAEHGGTLWINDAYNANPDSMRAGLEWLSEAVRNDRPDGRVFVVLGDMLELGENGPQAHREVLHFLASSIPSAAIVTVGPIMDAASGELRADTSLSVRNFADSTEAGKYIGSKIRRGDIVYLKGSRGMRLEKILPA